MSEPDPMEPSSMFSKSRLISVLPSHVYRRYVLDLWFERVLKPRLRGEAYLVRYIDDFVVCFQYRHRENVALDWDRCLWGSDGVLEPPAVL